MIVNFKENNQLNINIKPYNLCPNLLIFDSGVGGLSIFFKIKQFLPKFNYIYVFDNAAFPYGEKSENFIIKRVLKVLYAINKKYVITLAVIACNTASVVALQILRKNFDFPIIGVLPAIKAATYLTTNRILGLLATNCTIKNNYTNRLINNVAKKFQVEKIGTSKLVKLAENKLHGKTVLLKSIKQILKPWLIMKKPPDTIILGCTHFPLLKDELLAVLPPGTQLVDSESAVVRQVLWLLRNRNKTANVKFAEFSIVYYISLTSKIKKLLPFLYQKGFKIHKKLNI